MVMKTQWSERVLHVHVRSGRLRARDTLEGRSHLRSALPRSQRRFSTFSTLFSGDRVATGSRVAIAPRIHDAPCYARSDARVAAVVVSTVVGAAVSPNPGGPPSRGGGPSDSSGTYDFFRPSQSLWSTVVDLACIAAVVYLARAGVHEPVVWSILSGLIMGRFGIAHAKTVERSNRGGGDGDNYGGNRGGGGRSGAWPPPTSTRDPESFPRPIPAPPTSPARRPRDPPLPREEGSSASADHVAEHVEHPRASTTMRWRLADWIERRRSAQRSTLTTSRSWWSWSTHVHVTSLAALAVLTYAVLRLFVSSR